MVLTNGMQQKQARQARHAIAGARRNGSAKERGVLSEAGDINTKHLRAQITGLELAMTPSASTPARLPSIASAI